MCAMGWRMKHVKIARTYRLDAPVVRDLKQFQEEQELAPSETKIVQAAIIEFIEKRREAKRGARR